jgi:hypothetical protein
MIDLLTISRKAHLSDRLRSVHGFSKHNIDKGLDTFGVIEHQFQLVGQYKEFHNANYLMGFVTFLESYINDAFGAILYVFPGKLENKSFTIERLTDMGSISRLINDEASKQLNELTYKSFKDIVQVAEKNFGVEKIDNELVEKLNEIKCTRDIYAHTSGHVNETYLRKTGNQRRAELGNKLPVDDDYILNAAKLIEEFTNKLNDSFSKKYEKCRPFFVLKEMWEKSALDKELKFEEAWRIHGESIWPNELKKELDSPYKELYNFFLYVGNIDNDFDLIKTRNLWADGTKERTIINSWMDYQFHVV